MDHTVKEVLEFVRQNDVKFVRMSFCDLFGTQKSISIMPDELERAFQDGISFDGSNVKGFTDIVRSDLLLFPDPTTLSVLPWRPRQGRVVRFFCDIKNPDKTPFICDTRHLLKNAVKRCESMGYVCKIGTECEFYLFKTDENGEPVNIPYDEGGYLDIAPLDKGENVRREICLCLEEMGITPESSHHESGPGQNEIDFKYSDALNATDNFLSFKAAVKAIAQMNGLFASFMPKPIKDKNGSGLHINLSLFQSGFNIFRNEGTEHSKVAESFIAGILERAVEMTVFFNPLVNSYERLGLFEAPKYVSWSHQNRSQLIRIPATIGDKTRMELRSPDPALNPYLAFALTLHAGLDGIEKGLTLPEPINADLLTADKSIVRNIQSLPENLKEAIEIAGQSRFLKETLGDEILNKYIQIKESESCDFSQTDDKEAFYREQYFKTI